MRAAVVLALVALLCLIGLGPLDLIHATAAAAENEGEKSDVVEKARAAAVASAAAAAGTPADLLWVIHGTRATLIKHPGMPDNVRELTLHGVSPTVTWFANKPARAAGQLAVKLWTGWEPEKPVSTAATVGGDGGAARAAFSSSSETSSSSTSTTSDEDTLSRSSSHVHSHASTHGAGEQQQHEQGQQQQQSQSNHDTLSPPPRGAFAPVWASAPNAALFGRDKSWKPHTIVVSLSAPRYDPGETTLTFNATILSRNVDRDPWVKEEEDDPEAEAAAAEGDEEGGGGRKKEDGIGAGGTRGTGRARKTERERAGTDEHGAAGGLAAAASATSAAAAAVGHRKHSFDLGAHAADPTPSLSSSTLHAKSTTTSTSSTTGEAKKTKNKSSSSKPKKEAEEREAAEKKKKELIDLAEYTPWERQQKQKQATEKPPELELKGDAVALFVDDFSGASVVPIGPGYSGTNCLLPPGCLSANVCGWCPGRGGVLGGVGGGFGFGGFG